VGAAGRRRRDRRRDRGGAGRALPRIRARALQAPARVPLRDRAAALAERQDSPEDAPGCEGGGVTEYDGFRVERDGDVAKITLDVPGKFNRVSMLAPDQLRGLFEELGAAD